MFSSLLNINVSVISILCPVIGRSLTGLCAIHRIIIIYIYTKWRVISVFNYKSQAFSVLESYQAYEWISADHTRDVNMIFNDYQVSHTVVLTCHPSGHPPTILEMLMWSLIITRPPFCRIYLSLIRPVSGPLPTILEMLKWYLMIMKPPLCRTYLSSIRPVSGTLSTILEMIIWSF